MVSHASPRLRHLAGALLLTLASGAAQPSGSSFEEVIGAIEEKSVGATLRVIGGKEMQGRGSFSPGFDRAADHVSKQLTAFGYEPAGPDGTFRLPYELECVQPDPATSVRWTDMPADADWKLGEDFTPLLGCHDGVIEAPAVFAGFGLQSKDENWSDYKDKDVQGKILFCFTREPWADDVKQKRFAGASPTPESGLRAKARAAAEAGALGIVFVPDPTLEADDGRALLGASVHPSATGVGLDAVRQAMDLPPFPVMSVSREMAAALFDADLAATHAQIEKSKKAKVFDSGKRKVRLEAKYAQKSYAPYNLAARLKGRSGTGETLVLGAHLDHVGWGVAAEFGGAGLQIFPGADDNASGSTALLEVARAFAGVEPEIDVLFLWFSAEELGLLGSRAYCENPLVPMDKTVAMLNMDQIARTDPKEFNVGGTWERKEWAEFVQQQAKRAKCKLKIDFKAGRDLYARSDQYSFFAKGVPALFFFEGRIEDNKDYHKPTDVVETIDPAKTTEIARVFAACAYAIAVEGGRLR